ncbi:hypothetical protein OTU49_011893 [Cherax quadricarinatus]|uniref:Uncharacterized protein n=1 Tax=Cherax quadricarinatus TaxID=27406 RepID=A0AAW0W2X7_CHEQU
MAHLSKYKFDNPLKILLDNGAKMSQYCKKFVQDRGYHPSSLKLFVDGKNDMSLTRLSYFRNTNYDFVMGTDFLYKYSAIIDYYKQNIFFKINQNIYKTELNRISLNG